ncbi:MAG: DUF3857 domain-containing protein [Candidatus Zixiibacteriota bacterium]
MIRCFIAFGILLNLVVVVDASDDPPKGARIDSIAYRCRVDGNRVHVAEFRRLTVLNPSGDKHAYVAEYENRYIRLKNVNIRQYDASGKLLMKKSKGDMTKACGQGQSYLLYDDNCNYYMELPARSYPYTIEHETESDMQSLFFLRGFIVQRSLPVVHAVVELEYQDDRPIFWKLYNHDTTPEETAAAGLHKFRWIFDSIPATPELTYATAKDRQGAYLAFSAESFELEGFPFNGRTWKNVGLWQKQLSAGRTGADSLPTPLPATDAADSIACEKYREVTAATRYVAVSIGLSGWQPNFADLVAQRGYGDCKDMTCLLTAKLHASGIEAYPCLVMTAGEGWLDTSFVNFQFNHVITMAVVGGDTLWFDPTCSNCPPGDLPDGDEGIPVLVITDTGGVVVTTPLSTAEQNTVRRTAVVTIDTTGRVSVAASADVTGNHAHSLRAYFEGADREKTERYVKEWFWGDSRKFELARFELRDLDNPDVPLHLEAAYHAVKPIDRLRGIAYLPPFLFTDRDIYGGAKLTERTTPLQLGYARTISDSIIVTGPLIAWADSMLFPPDFSADFYGGHASWRYRRGNDSAFARYDVNYTGASVPVEQLPAFGVFLSERRKQIDAPIRVFVK